VYCELKGLAGRSLPALSATQMLSTWFEGLSCFQTFGNKGLFGIVRIAVSGIVGLDLWQFGDFNSDIASCCVWMKTSAPERGIEYDQTTIITEK
jgi:hypothetical protein